MTEHIQRYSEMDENTFLYHARLYRKFKNVSLTDHITNIQYINDRLHKHDLKLIEGCCNKFYIEKL